MVAGHHFADAASHLLDDARALVPQNDRLRHRKHLIAHRHIRMADAGGDEAHQNLVVARLGQFQNLQRHRHGRRAGDSGLNFHGVVTSRVLGSSDGVDAIAAVGRP